MPEIIEVFENAKTAVDKNVEVISETPNDFAYLRTWQEMSNSTKMSKVRVDQEMLKTTYLDVSRY